MTQSAHRSPAAASSGCLAECGGPPIRIVETGGSDGFESVRPSHVAEMNHQRAVRVHDVALRALLVLGPGKFGQRIMRGNCAVLGHAAFRAPAAAGEGGGECGIERAAVNAGLPAGDDARERDRDLTIVSVFWIVLA